MTSTRRWMVLALALGACGGTTSPTDAGSVPGDAGGGGGTDAGSTASLCELWGAACARRDAEVCIAISEAECRDQCTEIPASCVAGVRAFHDCALAAEGDALCPGMSEGSGACASQFTALAACAMPPASPPERVERACRRVCARYDACGQPIEGCETGCGTGTAGATEACASAYESSADCIEASDCSDIQEDGSFASCDSSGISAACGG